MSFQMSWHFVSNYAARSINLSDDLTLSATS